MTLHFAAAGFRGVGSHLSNGCLLSFSFRTTFLAALSDSGQSSLTLLTQTGPGDIDTALMPDPALWFKHTLCE
jgi:hypothetical protein